MHVNTHNWVTCSATLMSKDLAPALDENTRRYYLDAMGIQCWESLDGSVDSGTGIQQLEVDVQGCIKCQLHTTREQAILGRGSQLADLMFVLLSPDLSDDKSGVLCGGDAGDLFAKMLAAIDVSIDAVYITSLLKCSVPALHTVSTSEIHHCQDFLKQQIQRIQPRLLIVLGETAARCLLQKDTPIDELRSSINTGVTADMFAGTAAIPHQFESVPLFVSYSPQELMQQPDSKRKAWLDLQQIQKIIES